MLAAPARPRFEVADIFRAHGAEYRATHGITPQQREVMDDVERCRTAALGGHVNRCDLCTYEEQSYNSCRNRHCPKCQGQLQTDWAEKHAARTLPTSYFHVVFTLPEQLRMLTLRNRWLVYDLLFRAAAASLIELALDPRHLGAEVGVTAVLHTWSRELWYHPHVHCVVTGGGLTKTGDRWIPARRAGFFLPVRAVSAMFRGKFLAGLRRLQRAGALDLAAPCDLTAEGLDDLLDDLQRRPWLVYAKRSFGGPEQLFNYLGRYTHRVGLANSRLLDVDERSVTFATKLGRDVTLTPHEFIRRFLLHVLPKNFVRVRHYGLVASATLATKYATAMRLLGSTLDPAQNHTARDEPPEQQSTRNCPVCFFGVLVRHDLEPSAILDVWVPDP